jgi:hypothetical protein
VPLGFLNKDVSTVNSLDDVFECPWNDTLLLIVLLHTLHGMCFPCSGLTIGEDGAVVALENTLNDGECGLLEDPFLLAAWFEGEIEAEDSFLFPCVLSVMDSDLSAVRNHINDGRIFMFELPGRKGPASNCYLHALTLSHFNAI